MQRSCEMRIHPQLRRQAAAKYCALKCTIPNRIETIRNDAVNMCCAGEERVHADHARRHLMVLISDERSLLQLHGDRLYVLTRVQRARCLCVKSALLPAQPKG